MSYTFTQICMYTLSMFHDSMKNSDSLATSSNTRSSNGKRHWLNLIGLQAKNCSLDTQAMSQICFGVLELLLQLVAVAG